MSTVNAASYFTPHVQIANIEKITLFVSARNLRVPSGSSTLRTFAVIFRHDPRGGLVPLGMSEQFNGTDAPTYTPCFVLDYNFEVVQEFVVRIYNSDGRSNNQDLDKHTLIGGTTFHLATLMRAPNQLIVDTFQNGCGVLSIHGESLSSTRDNFVVSFSAQKLVNKEGFFSKSDPFLLISRQNEDGRWSVVWKNQHIDNNLNPIWPETKIPMALLCNADIDRTIKIEIFDYEKSGKHVFMGVVETNARMLLQAKGQPFPVIEPDQKAKKKSYVNSGVLIARNPSIERNATFADFIAGGCEISLTVAIDFTSSNGDPYSPSSLHFSDPTGALNCYEQAIVSVGEVLRPYDSDNMYPVFGFGAKIRLQDGSLSPCQHCFPVYPGGVEVHGIEGILQAYRDAKGSVTFFGPTLFTPLIRATTERVVAMGSCQESQKYMILLILTDGVINDLELTKQAIIDASHHPLSIIIVGVGIADFSEMHELDSDEQLLSSGGKTAIRDIVQFVAMRDFVGQQSAVSLAQHVLAEVPTQMLSYFQRNRITPNPPRQTLPNEIVQTAASAPTMSVGNSTIVS